MPPTEPGSTSAARGPGPGIHIVWWRRLGVRATAVFALVTLASVSVFVVVTLRAQQRYLTSEVLRGAAQFSDTIKASTYHFMLADERVGAYRTMEAIGRLQGIEKVRMLNKEGRVTFSTDGREVGPAGGQARRGLLRVPRRRPAAGPAQRPVAQPDLPAQRPPRAGDDHADLQRGELLQRRVPRAPRATSRSSAWWTWRCRSRTRTRPSRRCDGATLLFGGLGVLALAATVGLIRPRLRHQAAGRDGAGDRADRRAAIWTAGCRRGAPTRSACWPGSSTR